MTNIENISKETVEDVAEAVRKEYADYISSQLVEEISQAAITALLASGEVVLRKDVEESAIIIKNSLEGGWYPVSVNYHRTVEINDWSSHGESKTVRLKEAKFTTKPNNAGYASVHGGCAVLHRKCPKCGDNIIHNSTGFECGGMHCDYSEGGEPYRAEKFTTKPSETL